MIAFTSNLHPRFIKAMEIYLEENLRFDMEQLQNFDTKILRAITEVSKKKDDIKI